MNSMETMQKLREHDNIEARHWDECMQIAYYSEELEEAVKLLKRCAALLSDLNYLYMSQEIRNLLDKIEASKAKLSGQYH